MDRSKSAFWKGSLLAILAAFVVGVSVGFVGAKLVPSGSVREIASWSDALARGRTVVYTWKGIPPASSGQPAQIGVMTERATGEKKVIEGREFQEIEYSYEGIALPSGIFYLRATDSTVEMTFSLVGLETGKPIDQEVQVTTFAELPLKVGSKWRFLGETECQVRRIADYRDASGKIWKNCACVGIFLGSEPKGEFWVSSEVGLVALKMFLPNLGEMEWQLKEVKLAEPPGFVEWLVTHWR